MKQFLLPNSGHFFKANLHCHTTISDGLQTPEEVKALYQSLGYDAVCFTDHEVLVGHEDLCDERFVALHGYEVAIKQDVSGHTGYFQSVYHFNFLAKEQSTRMMPRFFLKNPSMAGNSAEWRARVGVYDENDLIEATEYDVDWINSYLEAVEKAGYLITYNHPEWSLQTANDVIPLEHIHAFEVINGDCARIYGTSIQCYNQVLRAGKCLIAAAGDDNHTEKSCGLGWTMIKAEALTYDALMKAYERGDCYVSEGPEFCELWIEDGEIVVRTHGAEQILLRAEGRYSKIRKISPDGISETRLPYHPDGFGRFFRLELTDAQGKKAFSRAYFTDEILTNA